MTLPVQKVREGAQLPRRATEGSAGMDLCACIDAPLPLPAGEIRAIPTGVAIAAPAGSAALVFGRSGLGIRCGVAPANAVGVIDSDYRGEIVVGLINHSQTEYMIQPGERIAQLVLIPVLTPDVAETEALDTTGRGTGGFGSTGRI